MCEARWLDGRNTGRWTCYQWNFHRSIHLNNLRNLNLKFRNLKETLELVDNCTCNSKSPFQTREIAVGAICQIRLPKGFVRRKEGKLVKAVLRLRRTTTSKKIKLLQALSQREQKQSGPLKDQMDYCNRRLFKFSFWFCVQLIRWSVKLTGTS